MKIMIKCIVAIVMLFVSCQSNKEKKIINEYIGIRTLISDSLKYIIEAPSIRLSRVGWSQMPKNLETFLTIREKATKKEIELLLKHSDSKVRCYAFMALRDRKYPISSALFQCINDTSHVDVSYGCVGNHTNVGNFCYWKIWEKDSRRKIDTCYLKENEIDSLTYNVLETNINKKLISDILTDRKLSDRYYPLIKERINDNSDPSYVVALANFQKMEDKRKIQDILRDSSIDYTYKYKIIEAFPLPEFHGFLARISDSLTSINKLNYGIWLFYTANSKFPGKMAIPLYRKVLNCTIQKYINKSSSTSLLEINNEKAMIVNALKDSKDKLMISYRHELITQIKKDRYEDMVSFD